MKILSMANSFFFSLFFLLLFILPIPHSIGIRNAFFYILIITSIVLIYKFRKKINFNLLLNNYILKVFLLLTLWIILSIFLFSKDFSWSLDEFRGQWLPICLYLLFGFFISILINNNILLIKKKTFITCLFSVLFIHILYLDFYVIYQYIATGIFEKRIGGLTYAADMVNYITNLLFAIITAETIYRITTKKNFIFFSNKVVVVIYILLFFSFIIEGLRNAIVPMLFMFIAAIYFLISALKVNKSRKILISFSLVFLISLPLGYSILNDKRWNSLIETVNVVSKNKDNIFWLKRTGEVPKLSNGEDVNLSNYLRFAWADESIDLIIEHPFGIGYSRNAFGYGVYLKYNLGRGMHSHSGILDFTIAVGIIGILIWFLFILTILIYSYKYFKKNYSFYALVVFFITVDFFSRSFLDSNMRDHIILEFMLLLGLFTSFMLIEENENAKN